MAVQLEPTMQVLIEHSVMFLLKNETGDVVSCYGGGYGRITHVTVRFPPSGRPAQVLASARRCKKDGSEDARFKGGNVITMVQLPNEGEWIERAKELI